VPGSELIRWGGVDRERLDRWGLWCGAASISLLILALPSGPSRLEWMRLGATVGLVVSVLLITFGRTRDSWLDRGVLALLLLTGASYLVSTACSRWPEASMQRSLGLPFAILAGIVAMRIGGRPQAFRWIAWASIAAVILLTLDLAWQGWTERSLLAGVPTGPRRQGSLANPNDLAMVVPLTALGFSVASGRRLAGLLVAMVGLAACAWVQRASDSRGLAIGLGATMAAWITMRMDRRGRWTIAGLLAIAVVAVLLATSVRQRGLISELVPWIVPGGESGSFEGVARQIAILAEQSDRPAMFAVAWTGFVENPWLGVGPGLFAEEWWHRRGHVPWGTVASSVGYMPWPHNLYLESLAERGGVGGLTFLLLVLLVSIAAWRAGRARQRDAGLRSTLVASMASLISLLAMGLVDLTLLKDWVSLLLTTSIGLSAGASAALRSSSDADEPGAQREHSA